MPHIPPLDPNVAARKGFRESEERLKRFWKTVHVGEGEGGWAVLLDGRTPKTPAGAPLVLPTAPTRPSTTSSVGEDHTTRVTARSCPGISSVGSTSRGDPSTTSTLSICWISARRNEPCIDRWRSRLNLAAAASNGSPSWNFTPGRSLIVTVLPSAEVSCDSASCGTMFSFSSMSNSLSQIDANTMRPT